MIPEPIQTPTLREAWFDTRLGNVIGRTLRTNSIANFIYSILTNFDGREFYEY